MQTCRAGGTINDIEAGKGVFPAWHVIDAPSCEAADIGGIEITADSPANLALDVLTEGGNYLAELRSFLQQVVEHYRGGDEAKGGERFMQLVSGLEWFVKVTSVVETLLKVDFAGTSCAGRTLAETIAAMNRILLEIVVSQEQRDWVLLADLLEYELATQLEQWQDIFAMLRQRVADSVEGSC